MIRLLPLALLACATLPESMEPSPPPTQALTLSVGAVIPGQGLTLTVDGLAPGERVFIGRGAGLGAGPCIGSAGGACLDIADPVSLLGSPTADASGQALLTLTVPSIPLGLDVGFQALARRGTGGDDSILSNPVDRTTIDQVLSLDDVGADELFITEVMANPAAVTDANGEWLEIHNPGPDAIDLVGLEVLDDGGSGFTIDRSVVIDGGGWAVLAARADDSVNGGVLPDWTWSSFNLANTSDTVVLAFGDVLFDSLSWDTNAGWSSTNGESLQLSSTRLDNGSNDLADNWCLSTTPFATDLGTPGEPNLECPFVVPNELPQASLNCPSSGQTNETLVFDASTSLDTDGAIFDYQFDFGDGITTSGLDAESMHAFAAPGTYTVELTVTDDRGGLATDSCDVEILPTFETVSFSVGRSFSGTNFTLFGPANWEWENIPPAVDTSTLFWNWSACVNSRDAEAEIELFGNGNGFTLMATTGQSCATQAASATIPAFRLNDVRTTTGVVEAEADIDDSCAAGVGCAFSNDPTMNSIVLQMQVPQPIPVLDCPASASIGQIVSLDGLASTAHWDALAQYAFEDDNTPIASGSQPAVGHSFSTVGEHIVTLTVTDRYGLQASTTCAVQVQ